MLPQMLRLVARLNSPTNQQPSKTKSENGLKITKALLETLIKVTMFLLNLGHSSPPPLSTCLHVFSMKILGKSSVVIKYKIITPQGNLMTGTGSPSGYTNEQKVTLNRSGYINLAGWGNTTGDAYFWNLPDRILVRRTIIVFNRSANSGQFRKGCNRFFKTS